MGEAPFTPDELRHYEDHGYVVKPRFFVASDLEPFVKRFLAIVNAEVPVPPEMTVMRDVMVAKGAVRPGSRAEAIAKVQDFQNDPVLYDDYVKHPRLLDAAEQFTGPDIKSIHTTWTIAKRSLRKSMGYTHEMGQNLAAGLPLARAMWYLGQRPDVPCKILCGGMQATPPDAGGS